MNYSIGNQQAFKPCRRFSSVQLYTDKNNQQIATNHHISFPLDSFLQRLELAGFYISPAERLRVMKVIRHFKKDNLRSPEKLKYLLCPIIAQGTADQEKFYELFDQFWEQMGQPWAMPEVEETPSWWEQNSGWLRWLIVALVLGGLGYALYSSKKVADPPRLKAHFTHDETVKIGEQLRFENLSENHDSLCAGKWEIIDEATEKIEYSSTDSFHLTYPVSGQGDSPNKLARFTSIHPHTKDTSSHESQFTVLCEGYPEVDSVNIADGVVGKPIDCEVFIKNTKGLSITWDMGDAPEGEQPVVKTGKKVQHVYKQEGFYEVVLIVSREGKQEGDCKHEVIAFMKIGDEKAYLREMKLQKDPIAAIVNFSTSMWILLSLLGIPIIWFWVKWATRPAPKPEEEGEGIDMEAAAARFRSPDKGPYKIPFRSNAAFVRTDRDIYRLADVMRQRQEGLRKEINVAASLQKTIDSGGFPQLITQSDEVPTEYLFLIDEQTEGSHQRHLFQWLVAFLQKREVYGEYYFYNEGLHRFWNDDHPRGISPSQLQRQYAFHKLVVLGDGHEFVSTSQNFEKQRPALRADASDFFGHWKHRFLLSPMPVVSWTFREGVLHDRFAIFPMDTNGLNEWLKYLESETEDEERPPYKLWSRSLLDNRSETDVNYRQWHTADDHKDYLKNHPHLYQWLCAIALYPKPEWDMSLAIGRSLSPVGVDVTHENLLVLSHVPWLISGDLNPRLRHQLLDDLDPETEQLAREAIKGELELAGKSVENGFANLEHQTNLVLQQFALNPKDAGAQQGIQQLRAMNLLSPRHRVELNQIILKEGSGGRGQESGVEERKSGGRKTKMDRSGETLDDFMEKNKPEVQPPKKPFFTRDFKWAASLSLLFLVLVFLVYKYSGTEQLAEWAGIDIKESTDCKSEYYEYGFLRKECVADSAVFYNNQAVEIWENREDKAGSGASRSARYIAPVNLDLADSLLNKAIRLRRAYLMAILNREKLAHNMGMEEYHAFLTDSSDQDGLRAAMAYFQKMELDTFKLASLHGTGLATYYLASDLKTTPSKNSQNDPPTASELLLAIDKKQTMDNAVLMYNDILFRDSSFFDTLSLSPNLRTLLLPILQKQNKEALIKTVDKETGRPLAGVLIRGEGLSKTTGANGEVLLKMDAFGNGQLNFSKEGYRSQFRSFTPAEAARPIQVEMILSDPGGKDFNMVFSIVNAKTNEHIPLSTVTFRSVADGKVVARYGADKGGRVRMEGNAVLSKQDLNVLVESAGYMTYRTTLAELLKAYQRKDVVFLMQPNYLPLPFANINFGMSKKDVFAKRPNLKETPPNDFTKGIEYASETINQDGLVEAKFTFDPGKTNTPFAQAELQYTSERSANAASQQFLGQSNNGSWQFECGDGSIIEAAYAASSNNSLLRVSKVWMPDEQQSPEQQQPPVILKSNTSVLYYDRDGTSFRADARMALDSLRDVLYDNPTWQLEITSHTEARGSAVYNQRLAERRAKAIVQYLTSQGVDKNRLITKAMGESEPAIINDMEADPARDRRVELRLIKNDEGSSDLDRLLKELEGDMVFVEGGTFRMGCDEERDGRCEDNEELHDVTLSGFRMAKYEVTQELWRAVMGSDPEELRFKGCDRCPVERVSWDDVQGFLQKLNERTGQKYRLPTEAEWEYAARGGTRSKDYRYSGSNDLNDVAWHNENSGSKTHPVGQLQPNELGLYDMIGNVFEWCSDWYGEGYYKEKQKGGWSDPLGPDKGERRVCRGGSWINLPNSCRAAIRLGDSPYYRFITVGFRVAQD